MTPERYQQVGKLFDEVLANAPAERAEWLRQACGADEELYVAVENLLAHHSEADTFLSRPALEIAATQTLSLLGQLLGHYRILSLLGTGGMGEVYLAEDATLRRKIALKVLPAYIAKDQEHLRRFKQEAFSASALNHPNIVTIHEFGAEGDIHFLATELVEGETLRDRLRHGALSFNTALDLLQQIASALQAAHEAGIVHRDIKPENIMIRRDGLVKVLDFGLAKITNGGRENARRDETVHLTAAGTVVGTVAYMSPEQARGQRVDACSDLFSLGVVLYEMLTSKRPFNGETPSHIIVAILETEPPLLGQIIPAGVEPIIKQLLAKKPDARYASAEALLADLKQLIKQLERKDTQVGTTPAEASTRIIQLQTNKQRGDVTMQQSSDDSSLHAVDLAHVLFCDLVEYSLWPIDRQTHVMQTLQKLVRQTDDYKRADAKGQLVLLPAGDGMALAFLQDVAAPVRCAVELLRALRDYPDIRLRIGIHSGPVYQSADINANRNVVGSGINLAQRVMDCGDAGHILVSRNVAEVLQQISHWQLLLHDLGEGEVKHGAKIHLYNLYSDEFGNSLIPAKLVAQQTAHDPVSRVAQAETVLAPAAVASHRKSFWWLGALLAALLVGGLAWQSLRPPTTPPTTQTAVLPECRLNYFLTVQRYRDGKPYQTEFQSSGREIFEAGWRFKLNVISPKEGYLYLLNEEPSGGYALLFPLPSRNQGSARLSSNERFQTNWYLLDDKIGTERFRLIWAAQPVSELEAVRHFVNPQDQGRITDATLSQAVKAFIERAAANPIERVHNAQARQTEVSGRGTALVALVELEHH